jgi:hypothetical protein
MRLIVGVNKRVSCRGLFSKIKISDSALTLYIGNTKFYQKIKDYLECNSQKYEHNTRGKNKLYIQACNTALFQKNSRLYNKLPERIRILENYRCFKKEVKLLLTSNTFYSVDEFLTTIFIRPNSKML